MHITPKMRQDWGAISAVDAVSAGAGDPGYEETAQRLRVVNRTMLCQRDSRVAPQPHRLFCAPYCRKMTTPMRAMVATMGMPMANTALSL